ncbi:MAG: aldehyde dehydrogenase family protein [Bryobacterales bacterium]|nr:aldehyde dehydrogenase family protein [Bryobacterales bacterium]
MPAPLSALHLSELLQEAGVSDGAVNIVTGFGEPPGAPLAEHPGVEIFGPVVCVQSFDDDDPDAAARFAYDTEIKEKEK